MRPRLFGLATALVVGGVIVLPLTAAAHALPQRSTPAEGSTVQQPPSDVVITFGEAPDLSLSSITVVNSSGTDVDAGPTVVVPGNPAALEVPLKPHLPDGVYTVSWKTVSAIDGHLATGSFAFGVGVPASTVPAPKGTTSSATPPSVFAVLMRLVLFIGLIVVVGAVVLGAFAFGEPTMLLRRVIAIGAFVALAGTVGVVASQAVAAGVTFTSLFSSSLGRSLIVRGIPALALTVCALLVLRGVRARELSLLAGVAAIGAMGVDAFSSHAAGESPITLNEFAQWLHITAVGVWIGGLVALVVSVLGAPSDNKSHVVRRLSTLAGVGLVVVAATGVFRAVIEVQTWSNLVNTAFGLLVLLKIGLLLILATLGAINRYRNVPRLPRALRALRRVVSTEIIVALAALTVAAALVNVAPPAEYAAAAATAQPVALVVNGSDYATTVKVRLTVTPGTAGFNVFNLRVSDYDTGATVAASRVLLQFEQPLRPQLGESTLTLRRQPDGSFQAHGGNLSLNGVWAVAAIIEYGERSTEVHLQVTTIEPAPLVTSSKFQGLPLTLYTVQLSKGRTVQVYIDPNRPGADEFHTTFFSGFSETQMSAVTIGMTPPGGTPTVLPSRRLDPVGHFVADATIPSGSTRFDIIATLPGGEVISTYLMIVPGR